MSGYAQSLLTRNRLIRFSFGYANANPMLWSVFSDCIVFVIPSYFLSDTSLTSNPYMFVPLAISLIELDVDTNLVLLPFVTIRSWHSVPSCADICLVAYEKIPFVSVISVLSVTDIDVGV